MKAHTEHFQDLEQRADAGRLAVWVVIASELLFFSGLFGIYGAERSVAPAAFAEGVRHMDRLIGSANTLILLTSSLSAALALASIKAGNRRGALAFIGLTMLLAFAFLGLKTIEYHDHLVHGLGPGMAAPEGGMSSMAIFVSLYWLMTGLHALHVCAGIVAFAWVALRIRRGLVNASVQHPLECVALYWHFVDVVWIFLWPTFYLTRGGG